MFGLWARRCESWIYVTKIIKLMDPGNHHPRLVTRRASEKIFLVSRTLDLSTRSILLNIIGNVLFYCQTWIVVRYVVYHKLCHGV